MSPRAAANVCIFDGVPRWIRVMLFEKGLCASSFCSNEVLNWVAVKGDFFSPASRLKPASFSIQLLSLSPASFSIQPVIAQLLNLSPASFSTQSVD